MNWNEKIRLRLAILREQGLTRILVGLAMILIAFILKSLFNHNIEFWGAVKSITLLLFLIGLVIVLLPIFERVENVKPKNFRSDPLAWLKYVVLVLITLGFTILLVIGLEDAGIRSNNILRDFYISRKSEVTNAVIIGEREVSFISKFRSTKIFYLIRYRTNNGIIVQGAEPNDKLWNGKKLKIRYSTDHPSFFEIVDD